VLPQELLVAEARGLLDDGGQDAVAHVGVAELLAGGRLEAGRQRPGQHVVPGDHVVVVAEALGEAGGVAEQVVQRDPALVGGHRAEVGADRVGHPQLPHHLQLEHRRRGELLGDRHDVVHRVAGGGRAGVVVGPAEALAVRHVPAPTGDDRAAEPVRQSTRQVVADRIGRRLAR
jgi:hypothetical protein